jgi:hypothetical protein
MNISGYRFGRIDIGGRTYTSDVIVTPECVIDGWMETAGPCSGGRRSDEVVAARPDVLVIGVQPIASIMTARLPSPRSHPRDWRALRLRGRLSRRE